jgi:hypothetical protein
MKTYEEYHLAVDIPEGKCGVHEIKHKHHPAGHTFHLGTKRTTIFGGDSGEEVTFPFPTRWHTLNYNGGTWMSDYPIEQAQHDKELEKFSGEILVGGLGLGYAANVLAAMGDVEYVRIIELSDEVIQLVKPHLKDPDGKVEVVHADLLEYVKGESDLIFSHAFFDIWQSDSESTFHCMVEPLRVHTVEFGWVVWDNDIVCWNEKVMRSQLYMNIQAKLSQIAFYKNPKFIQMYKMEKPPERFFARPAVDFPTIFNPGESSIVYHDWSVPFFEWWYGEGCPDDPWVQKVMGTYVGTYGRFWWKEVWKQYVACRDWEPKAAVNED